MRATALPDDGIGGGGSSDQRATGAVAGDQGGTTCPTRPPASAVRLHLLDVEVDHALLAVISGCTISLGTTLRNRIPMSVSIPTRTREKGAM